MKIKIIISSIVTTTVLFLFCSKFINQFSARILCLSFIISAYYSKYLDCVSFNNGKNNVDIECNSFGVPRLRFDNVKIIRTIAGSYIWASKLIAFFMSFLIAVILKPYDKSICVYPLIGVFIGSLFHLKDLQGLYIIWFGKRDSLYVQFLDTGVELIKTEGVKYSHREVYFYEETYKAYKIDDLRRELILSEQEINDNNRVGIWDRYLLPIILIFASSVFGIINSTYVVDLTSNNFDSELLLVQYLGILLTVTLLITLIFLIKHFICSPPKSNLIVKKMVLEDLLKSCSSNDERKEI